MRLSAATDLAQDCMQLVLFARESKFFEIIRTCKELSTNEVFLR